MRGPLTLSQAPLPQPGDQDGEEHQQDDAEKSHHVRGVRGRPQTKDPRLSSDDADVGVRGAAARSPSAGARPGLWASTPSSFNPAWRKIAARSNASSECRAIAAAPRADDLANCPEAVSSGSANL